MCVCEHVFPPVYVCAILQCLQRVDADAATLARVCLHAYSMQSFECVGVDQCVCVYACVHAQWSTSITQSRELQSVKSTLTFMVLTSQGHFKAEHLE